MLLNSFFNPALPLFIPKTSAFAIDDVPGLWRVHWQFGNVKLLSTFYTQHDQACLLWSGVALTIFTTAQFVPLSWKTQSLLWTVLTLIGLFGMVCLTWSWSRAEKIAWILYSWVGLMLLGLGLTNLSIFLGWGEVLIRLCPLWLGLSALGYLLTAVGMRSRAFLLIGLLHVLGMAVVPYVGPWQHLLTGTVLGLGVFLVAELQWDAQGVCGTRSATFSVGSN